jgi:hypothetical protein
MDCDDVRMLEDGGSGGLRSKALDEFLARQRSRLDHLDRHDASEFPLPRLVNDAHAAARNFLQQIVVAERSQLKTLTTRLRGLKGGWRGRRFRLMDLACGVRHVERAVQSARGA